MTPKQTTAGWLALGLVLANIIDGPLRSALKILWTKDPAASGQQQGGGGHGFHVPRLPLVDPFYPFPMPGVAMHAQPPQHTGSG